MTRLGIVCLLAGAAVAQEETARKVVAGPGDLSRLCHRWEAPEWAPFEMKQFPQGKYAAQAPQVNADRAVVTLSDNMHLWLTRQEGKWGCVGWRRSRDLSMEWLHQDGKPAIADLPEDAADAFVSAIGRNDRAAAEAQCTTAAWTAKTWGLATVFENTRKSRADLRRIAMAQHGRRAYVQLHVSQNAVAKGRFFLLVLKIGRGWLLAGVTAENGEADEFLKNKPWPFDPATAKELPARFLEALNRRASWRMKRLCTGGYRLLDGGLKKFTATAATHRGEVRATSRRATCLIDKTVLLMIKTPRGWRIDGHTADRAYAARFLKGEVSVRR